MSIRSLFKTFIIKKKSTLEKRRATIRFVSGRDSSCFFACANFIYFRAWNEPNLRTSWLERCDIFLNKITRI